MSRRPTLATLLLSLALAGCNGSEPEPEPAPPPEPVVRKETLQHLPELPDRWRREVNRAGGFAFGLPPGWTADRRGTGSLVRSFDRLVALSIVPNRRKAAFEVPLHAYARRAAGALPGFRSGPRLLGVGRFGHRYDGVEALAVGTARGGVDQRLSVIVLRRDRMVTFTVVLARNARRAVGPSKRVALRVISTLRSRPPRAQGSGRSG